MGSVAAPKSLPAHSFNALIFPILRGCVQSFVIFLSLNSIPSWFIILLVQFGLLSGHLLGDSCPLG